MATLSYHIAMASASLYRPSKLLCPSSSRQSWSNTWSSGSQTAEAPAATMQSKSSKEQAQESGMQVFPQNQQHNNNRTDKITAENCRAQLTTLKF